MLLHHYFYYIIIISIEIVSMETSKTDYKCGCKLLNEKYEAVAKPSLWTL